MEPEFLTRIEAKTALETPQIMVSWEFDDAVVSPIASVPWSWLDLYLRVSLDRFPEAISEGTDILTTDEVTTSISDISRGGGAKIQPFINYYYSLFLRYREHDANPVVLDSDISRTGTISAVVQECSHRLTSPGFTPGRVIADLIVDAVKSGSSITSASSTFYSWKLEPGDLVEVLSPGDPDIGFHLVVSVDSQTQITVDSALTPGGPVAIQVLSGHKTYWLAGIDYHRKQVLWRYDATSGCVTDKVDLTGLLEFEEYVQGLAIACQRDIAPASTNPLATGSCEFVICTQTRLIWFNNEYEQPTTVLLEMQLDDYMTAGFAVVGATASLALVTSIPEKVYVLDSVNAEVVVLQIVPPLRLASSSMNTLVSDDQSDLKGIALSYDGNYFYVGNHNYVYELPSAGGGGGGGEFIPSDVTTVLYSRDLLRADFGYSFDNLELVPPAISFADSTINKLREYELLWNGVSANVVGTPWQQPNVVNANCVALYHLNGNVIDSGSGGYNGSVSGMTVDASGRFGSCYATTSSTSNISIVALAAAWPGDTGTVAIWVKANSSLGLTSGTSYIFKVDKDSNNYLHIKIVSGSLVFERKASGTAKTISGTHPSPDTEWHLYECTWDVANTFKAYMDGSQFGTTLSGLSTWVGVPVAATIGATAQALQGKYDECMITDTLTSPRLALVYSFTSANHAHAFSGRSYTDSYDDDNSLGFFYRDEVFTPKFTGGDFLIRNDYERERMYPADKELSSGEIILRGPDPLPTVGDCGRLSRLIGLFFDRIADDREALKETMNILFRDVDFFSELAYYLGIRGLDQTNWNVDKQRRYLRIMPFVHSRGGERSSYRILAKVLGYYVTLHTLQARRRWDSVYYNAYYDSEVQAIPLDTMGSMDTFDERFPLALLRFIFYKLSMKSSTGVTSAASSRLLTDASGQFTTSVQVGSLIVPAVPMVDAGSSPEEAEYKVVEVHSDTVLKVDRNWVVGGQSNVVYYNFWEIPTNDPDTDSLLTRFFDIAPDSMRIERYVEV